MKEDLPTLRFESLLSKVLLVLFQASGATEDSPNSFRKVAMTSSVKAAPCLSPLQYILQQLNCIDSVYHNLPSHSYAFLKYNKLLYVLFHVFHVDQIWAFLR